MILRNMLQKNFLSKFKYCFYLCLTIHKPPSNIFYLTLMDKKQISLSEFVHNAIRLPDDEFEMAMRFDDNDKDINDIEIISLPLDFFDKN